MGVEKGPFWRACSTTRSRRLAHDGEISTSRIAVAVCLGPDGRPAAALERAKSEGPLEDLIGTALAGFLDGKLVIANPAFKIFHEEKQISETPYFSDLSNGRLRSPARGRRFK
jgi:hypothetical protein